MKKSFADCGNCSLCDSTGKICETNTPKNLLNIDELYIADPNDWDIIKQYAEKKKIKYVITAPILCSVSGKKEEDLNIIFDICKINAIKIIEKCTPRKLIAIGSLAKNFLSFCKNNQYLESITQLIDIKPKSIEEELITDLSSLTNVEENKNKEEKPKEWNTVNTNNVYMFTIPEKYYTHQYRLIDVQQIASQRRIIYIFRDKENKKEYYEVPAKENDFYWYESFSGQNKNIEPYSNLKLIIGNYKDRCITNIGYGGDVNLTTLHTVDYFLQNKEEAAPIRKNIVFTDIEIYTYKVRTFPDPEASQFPINAISFGTEEPDNQTQIYLLKIPGEIDPKIDEIMKSKKYKYLTLFTDEYSMIRAYLSKVKELDPDFICGWNSNEFDIPYIVGRMKKLSIDMKDLSPFGNVYADKRGRVIITGMVALDQLVLFKNDTTRPTQPSYKLDNIAETVLGKKKVVYEGNLNNLYNEDIDKFIQYSITDTDLLKGIEERVQHVALQDELRRITTTSHSGAASTLGQAEGLFMTSMKKKGLIARNKSHGTEKGELPGAYVFEARGGLYDGILCDFDFASLYPSIINSFNIGPDTMIGRISDDDAFKLIYNPEELKEIKIVLDPIHSGSETVMTIDEFNKFVKDNDAQLNIAGTIFCGHGKCLSIFNTVISMLFNGRKVYKAKMFEAKQDKNKKDEVNYNGKQMAFKILSNALYGVLGNEHFKFYNIDLARSITLTGQELLKYSTVHIDEYLVKRGNVKEFKVNKDFMNKVKSLKEVIYGDTDSAFLFLTDYLKDKKIEVKKSPEVFAEIQKIQDYVNGIALEEFLKLHHIDKKYSMIFLKNEYIFSKYYTLNGKKHYAAKIIAQEGRDVSDIEIKGIETRRSEIPERSRTLLKEILNIILSDTIKKEDIKDTVEKLVEKTKLEMRGLIEQRNNSIVRTVSYSKPLAEYRALPRHIKAMLIWNLLVNEDFHYGSKGKLWDIKAIDLSKAPESVKSNYLNKVLKKYNADDVDCICLPEDVNILPDYFIPNDKSILEYCCDDRVANLVEPLWTESNQALLW